MIMVVCVLAMVAGFVGFQAKKILGQRQFASSQDSLYNLCKMGQWLALSHQDEIHLSLRKDEKGYTASLSSYSPLPILRRFENVPLRGLDQVYDKLGAGLDISFSPRAEAHPARIFVLERGGEKKYVNVAQAYLVTTRAEKEMLDEPPFENPLAASPRKK